MSAFFTSWRALLDRSTTRVVAFDPLGGSAVPLPGELSGCAAQKIETKGPLDMLEKSSRPAAVVAYERARREGRGGTLVHFRGEASQRWLEVIDVTEAYGCFLGILTEADEALVGAPDSGAALAPRRCSYQLNSSGIIESIDENFSSLFGWKAADVVGTSSLDLIHPDDHEAGIVAWIEMLERPGTQTRLRQRFRSNVGEWIWCEVTDTNGLDDPERGTVSGELVDVSRELAAQTALQQRETLLQRLSNALPTGILHESVEHATVVSNERWQALTGFKGAEGLDRLLDFVDDRKTLSEALAEARHEGMDVDLEVSFEAQPGICRYGQLHLRPLREGGRVFGLLATIDDTTALLTYQQELASQARRDLLTGISNRLGTEELLRQRLATDTDRRRSDDAPPTQISLLFCDLDGFKQINDTYGHAAGDRVLQQVATELVGLLREGDHVGRLGGDEFVVVLEGESSHERADATALRIRNQLATIEIDASPRQSANADGELRVEVSIGIAAARPGDDPDALLDRADAEMYREKERRQSTGRSDTMRRHGPSSSSTTPTNR